MSRARISLDLPAEMVERLQVQVEATGVDRRFLIETAVEGMLREFEQIDAECGRPCTCGSPKAHARHCAYLPAPASDTYETSEASNSPRRPQRGSATLEFMLMLGLLVFPIAGLVSVTSWPERLNAAHAAAYEAARAVVEAPDPSAGQDLGRQRALEVLSNHGLPTDDVSVTFSAGAPGRGEPLTATVTITLPALTFPGVTTWGAVRFSKSSTQRVGDFREFR